MGLPYRGGAAGVSDYGVGRCSDAQARFVPAAPLLPTTITTIAFVLASATRRDLEHDLYYSNR